MRRQKSGYQWMRVGSADARFTILTFLVTSSAMIYLAWWVYRELPTSDGHLAYFLALYFVAAILYANLGVWIHEHLHCLGFRGTVHEKRAKIVFKRKYLLALKGHYRVTGALPYRVMRRALLGPSILALSLLVTAGLGSLILPGWWLPFFSSIAVLALLDMIQDFYWVSQIRAIGEKGKYWDKGGEMDVVWKE